ncbi:MAG: hypothetical protein JWR69_4557, partial [Pedosphaera sp.]|nr:hypothetical protein [Pedosphaera sp.]
MRNAECGVRNLGNGEFKGCGFVPASACASTLGGGNFGESFIEVLAILARFIKEVLGQAVAPELLRG